MMDASVVASAGILILLGALIVIHEAGHLAVAKLVGIPIAEFSVGFGPRLASRVWRGTEYSLRALPLGGFVLPAADGASEFRAIPLRKRLAFFCGGPLANLLAAVPLFAAANALGRGVSFSFRLADPGSVSGVIGIAVEGARLAQGGMIQELATPSASWRASRFTRTSRMPFVTGPRGPSSGRYGHPAAGGSGSIQAAIEEGRQQRSAQTRK